MLQARGIAIVRIPNELLIRDWSIVEEIVRAAINARR
jgi:hypothetical protein